MAQFMKGLPNMIAFILVTKGDHLGNDMAPVAQNTGPGQQGTQDTLSSQDDMSVPCPTSPCHRLYHQCG